MCNDSSLLGILSIVKRMVLLIQIVVPILLIIFGVYSFIKLLQNPDEKNDIKKIINQFLAAGVVFFIPLIVNVVMGILGEKTNLSSCWNSANDKITMNSKYIEIDETERKKIIPNADDYESGISSYWEINNNQYIYHYLDGTTKEWTISEYEAWKKLKEQNVKALDPTAYEITGKHIYYAGFKQYYVCKDNTANNKAIKNGGSPYAITVDLDNFRESVFENNGTNNDPIWEPIKSVRVNHGGKFDYEVWKKLDHKLFAKNCKTPQGLFYTNGAHWDNVDDKKGHILRYWVSFGTKGRINSSLKVEDVLYLHEVTGGKSVGNTNSGCVTSVTEHAKWIYYNIGRGTPILIW